MAKKCKYAKRGKAVIYDHMIFVIALLRAITTVVKAININVAMGRGIL